MAPGDGFRHLKPHEKKCDGLTMVWITQNSQVKWLCLLYMSKSMQSKYLPF